MFENKLLRTIFGPEKDDTTGRWKIVHNEELHNFYSPANIISAIKSRINGKKIKRLKGRYVLHKNLCSNTQSKDNAWETDAKVQR